MENYDRIIKQDMEELWTRDLPYNKFRNSTVLITGASGMLASYMTYFLMFLNEKGYNIRVITLVRNAEKAWKKFKDFQNNNQFQLMVQDVCDEIKLEGDVDYIIHAAGNASPYYIVNDPTGIVYANTIGTMRVAELAKEKRTKMILYTSTREVYGKMPGNVEQITEDLFGSLDPLEPRSCYPESKRMAETILNSYYCQYKVPFIAVRIAHSYGPGMMLNNDGRVMADFISDVVQGRDIVLKSAGTAKRAFCYITDAVAGILFALLKGQEGNAYNVANENEEVEIRTVAEMLTKCIPEKNLSVVFDIPETMSAGYSKMGRVKLDTDKLENLGWNCRVSLKQGLQRTLESFRE